MLPDSARDFVVEAAPLAHLATLNPDGSPHVTLAWADVQDGEIVIATLFDQRKLANIRRDPRVAVSFESDVTRPPGLREYLVVEGRARVEEGGAAELLRMLAGRYLAPGADFPPMAEPPAGYLTRITVERVRGVGPWAE